MAKGKTEWLARKGARSVLAMFEMFSIVKLLEMSSFACGGASQDASLVKIAN